VNPLAILGAVPLWVYPMAGLVLWGGCGMLERHDLVQKLQQQKLDLAEEREQALDRARMAEVALGDLNAETSKKLLASRRAVERAAGDTDRRLRDLAAAWAASAPSSGAGATCRDDGAPAVALLPAEARDDLVALAQDAEDISERLVICQQYVRELREKLK
jgi:hypothetical protein